MIFKNGQKTVFFAPGTLLRIYSQFATPVEEHFIYSKYKEHSEVKPQKMYSSLEIAEAAAMVLVWGAAEGGCHSLGHNRSCCSVHSTGSCATCGRGCRCCWQARETVCSPRCFLHVPQPFLYCVQMFLIKNIWDKGHDI